MAVKIKWIVYNVRARLLSIIDNYLKNNNVEIDNFYKLRNKYK